MSKVETGERNLTVDQMEKLVNLYGYSLRIFADEETNAAPIRFAYRAEDVTQEDLQVIADIGKIAINSQFMARLLEEANQIDELLLDADRDDSAFGNESEIEGGLID